MDLMEFNIANVLRINEKMLDNVRKFSKRRYLYSEIVSSAINGRDKITGIIGQRGVGKTILLLQLLEKYNALYISFDMYNMRQIDIGAFVSFVEDLMRRKKRKILLIDEIHYYKNYPALLKLLYDTTHIKVIFTSSVSILMSKLKQDLSRRVQLKYLYPFDYKEFLDFSKNIKIEYIYWNNLLKNEISNKYLIYDTFFKEYLSGGIFPFYNEVENFKNRLGNILERIIKEDIVRINNININELHNIEDMLKFIGKSEIDGISFSSLSKNLNITIYKIKQYVEILEETFVLNKIFPRGTNIKKEPKILFTPPFRLLYKEYDECIGGLREDFGVQMIKQKGFNIFYLKGKRGEKRPDYFIEWRKEKIIIEIGGKYKGFAQFKGFDEKYKKIIFKDNWINSRKSFPLYILGLINK